MRILDVSCAIGVVSKFGVTIGKMDWLQDRSSWSLASLDGKDLGSFDFVVATDKNIASRNVSGLTGKPPPLGLFNSILFIICHTYYHMISSTNQDGYHYF